MPGPDLVATAFERLRAAIRDETAKSIKACATCGEALDDANCDDADRHVCS